MFFFCKFQFHIVFITLITSPYLVEYFLTLCLRYFPVNEDFECRMAFLLICLFVKPKLSPTNFFSSLHNAVKIVY
uniref:Uncharacterized protein n=1 Tax=Macaca fascicularis TaxID=9541 RepID=Q9GMJ1_MACFA|nr:hypothetical protein [Macaca fascicularis]